MGVAPINYSHLNLVVDEAKVHGYHGNNTSVTSHHDSITTHNIIYGINIVLHGVKCKRWPGSILLHYVILILLCGHNTSTRLLAV